MIERKLGGWDQLDSVLVQEFRDRMLVTRNFERVVFHNIGTADQKEFDNLGLVRKAGTDRTKISTFWNEPGFDYDHDKYPSGKLADEIIYARSIKIDKNGVTHDMRSDLAVPNWQWFDYGSQLEEELNALTLYDPSKLERMALNEYWFKGNPLDAAVALIYVGV